MVAATNVASINETDIEMKNQKSYTTAVLKALFVVFLWATSWILIKIGLQDIPALTFAGLRYTIAFICLIPVVILSRRATPDSPLSKKEWTRLLILGILLYSVTQGAIFLSLSYLPSVTVNLLWSFSSIIVAVMGVIWLAERPSQFQWLGLGLATLGAVIYFYPVMLQRSQVLGVVVALVGILANAGAVIFGRNLNRAGNISPVVVTVISMGFGSIALLIAGLSIQGLPNITIRSWLIIGWLAIVNTAFAFTVWNDTLRTLSAMESSIINGTMLIWIPILAIIFLGETITGKEFVGLIVAGVGTLIVQLRHPSFLSKMFDRKSL
jgi:drug/metabolite transporter (DMT)-like permease